MSKYNKFVVALAAAAAQFGIVAKDGIITGNEWLTVAAALVGAFGVFQVRNAK